MKQLKRFFLFALCAFVMSHAFGTTYSGTCGDNLTWKLDTSTGVLDISGTGDMDDYVVGSSPWYAKREVIKKVVISSGITNIGRDAFCDCASITSVVIPEGVKSIGYQAFCSCASLVSIKIPQSVTSIGDGAIQNCFNLTSITFPEDLASIGKRAFQHCHALASITIPEGVTKIGDGAFDDCTSLSSIVVMNPVPCSIAHDEYKAIFPAGSIITVPYGCSSAYKNSNSEWSNYTYRELPEDKSDAYGTDGNISWIYEAESGTLELYGIGNMNDYSYVNGRTTAPWGEYLNAVKKVVIHQGVANIGNFAFCEFRGLTSVSIPKSVTSIGDDAFVLCTNLASVSLPEEVTSLGYDAFCDCTSLVSINIPKGVTSIGCGAFARCSFTSIVLPEGLTKIEKNTFLDCRALSSINIPNGVQSIGYGAFARCNLSFIVIPKSVTSIDGYAFDNCSNLKVVINNSPLNITKGSTANGYVGRFADVIWTNAINEGDFWTCYQGEEKVAAAYVGASAEANIPSGVSIIGNYAFQNQSSLTSITIPEGVTSIGNYAFQNCPNIQHAIILPMNPPLIGQNAFPAGLPIIVFSSNYVSNANWSRYNVSLACQLDEAEFVYTGTAPELKFESLDLFSITYKSENIEKDCGNHVLEIVLASPLFSNPITLNIGYTITPRLLTISACSVEREYGQEIEYGYVCDGFVEGEDIHVLTKEPTMISSADKDSDVGEYLIIPNGAEAKNYSFKYVCGRLVIVPVSQEIVWNQEFPSEVLIGSEYELTAVATSGLPVSYIVDDAYVSDLYEYDGKTYFGCNVLGTLSIRAVQEGDKNHKSARRVSKTINVVKELTGVDEVASDMDIAPIYDLSGRRVDASDAVRGIYIQNGKKVYRK